MHKLHISIIAIGIAFSVLLSIAYYWANNKLSQRETSTALGVGLLLGVVAIGAQSTDYLIFTIILAAYIAYFVHLKNTAEFNAITESTMVSLFMGSVMGFSSLLGCLVCM